MNSGKCLLILTPGFPENESDENCIPLLQVYMKALRKSRPDLNMSVIAFQYPFKREPYIWHGISVFPLGGRNKKGLARLCTWYKVWQTIKSLKPSNGELLLHSFWLTECYWMGSFFSKLYRTKHVATVLGQDAKRENLYLRLLKDKSCSIVCCSQFAATVLEKEQGLQCRAIIPLGVDALEFQNTQTGLRTIDIVGVGNLGPIKRFDVFVKVIAEIKKIRGDITAEIIGEGEFRMELQSLIDELGLTNNLKLIGGIPRSLVLQKLKQAKLLLHTSSYEGQGYVYLEALASGANVVALNRGFLPPSEKVAVVEKDEDLANACLNMLDQSNEGKAFLPVQIEQTVKDYLKLYNI